MGKPAARRAEKLASAQAPSALHSHLPASSPSVQISLLTSPPSSALHIEPRPIVPLPLVISDVEHARTVGTVWAPGESPATLPSCLPQRPVSAACLASWWPASSLARIPAVKLQRCFGGGAACVCGGGRRASPAATAARQRGHPASWATRNHRGCTGTLGQRKPSRYWWGDHVGWAHPSALPADVAIPKEGQRPTQPPVGLHRHPRPSGRREERNHQIVNVTKAAFPPPQVPVVLRPSLTAHAPIITATHPDLLHRLPRTYYAHPVSVFAPPLSDETPILTVHKVCGCAAPPTRPEHA